MIGSQIRRIDSIRPSLEVVRRPPVNLAGADSKYFQREFQRVLGQVWLHHLESAIVTPESVVLQRGRVQERFLAAKEHSPYYGIRYRVKRLLFTKRRSLDGTNPYVLATDNWSNGYFHWFGDVIPRLYLIRDRLPYLTLLLFSTFPSYARASLNIFDLGGLK